MKKIYLLFLIFFVSFSSFAGTIKFEGFNGSTSVLTPTGGSFATALFPTGVTTGLQRPLGISLFSEGTDSRVVQNGTMTITSSAPINTSACTNIEMTFDLMAISGNTTNGMEASDYVNVEVYNGTTWYPITKITGASSGNAYWGYNTAAANVVYNTGGVYTTFAATTTGDRTATGDGYSKIKITGLPSVTGLQFRITMANNGSGNENWVIDNFYVTADCSEPEMEVKGNGVVIADGDITPSTTDSTDFGVVCVGSTLTRTFKIKNTGTVALNLTGSGPTYVAITGTHAGQYSITANPTTPIAAGDSTTFDVRFTPTGATGARNAILTIANNDADENPYNFNLTGTATVVVTPTVSIAVTTGSNPMCAGASATFTATPANLGGGTASYQWKLNGSNVGTNSTTYTNASLANSDIVSCVMTITGGCVTSSTANSNSITMTVNALPATPSNPTAAANPSCGATTLNTMVPTGGETWFWQGTTNNGKLTGLGNTGSTYAVNTTNTYYVQARNNTTLCWSANSGSVLVTINSPVTFSPQPTNQVGTVGGTVTFSLTASGTGISSYQWQVSTNGGGSWSNVSTGTGGTTNSYTTPTLTSAMSGYQYKCIVTGTCGPVTSNVANLTVNCVNEGFEATGFPYTGWDRVNTFGTRITSNFRSGAACLSMSLSTLGDLRMPAVNRPSSISFWMNKSGADAGNELQIQISTVSQKTGYTKIATYTDADVAGTNNYAGNQKTIDLSAYSEYDAVFINFVSLGGGLNSYRIDDIQVVCSSSACTIPTNVPGAHGNPGNGSAILNWYYPSCYEEIMIVANTTSGISFSPTGDGSAYTANSVYGGVNSVVYKGTGSTQTVTGLTNGVTYYFEIFTRKGTTWSSGYEIQVTPEASPIHCLSNFTDISDEYISKVQVAGINNPSYVYDGYANYTYIQTDMEREASYPITVDNGQDFDGDYCYVWVDWNHDGLFSNTIGTISGGERYVMTGLGGGTAQFTGSIMPPTVALDGLAKMRVTLVYDATTPAAADCSTALNYGETEDYTINVLAPCVADFTVTDFFPKSGTSESWVRITGTNLNNVTSIKFGDVIATTYQISPTEIRVELPVGATTNQIVLANAADCKVRTSAFTVIDSIAGSCSSGGASKIFISEIYDPASGNNHYIEIFNGTGATVNLSGYSLQVINISGATTINGAPYTLTGTLAPNAVAVVWAGSAGSLATQGGPGNGFNADDKIRLFEGATKIDEVICPAVEGYTLIRKATVMAPNSTYTASEWNISLNPNHSTANIGLHTFNGTPSLVITTLPTDQTVSPCDAATFTFNATGTGVTFQWYVNDMFTDTWTAVSTGGVYTVTNTSTTTTLVVNPMANKDSFQFYCVVTAGACTKYIRAVQLYEGNNNKPVFRSVASGDWTTVANWEVATSELGPWTAACVYPRAENSRRVIIQSGTSIVLNLVNDVDSMEVQANATLEITPLAKLTIKNGNSSGADLFVNGTLYDNTELSTLFETSATWLMGANGTIIKSRNSSSAVYRDNYQGGISTIPATANWIIRYIGVSQPNVVTSNMYFPNLYWENTTGVNYNFNSSSNVMTGNSGFATVKGSMFVGTTGTSTVAVFNNNTNAQPLLILGNLEIGNGSYLRTTSYNGTEPSGTGVELRGDAIINGILIITDNTGGASARLFKLSGGNIQNVSGTGTVNIHNIEVNKSANYVKLDRNLRAMRNLNLAGGHIVIDTTQTTAFTGLNYFELGENTTDIGTLTLTDPNSYILGKMRRWFTNSPNSGIVSGLFPLGANDPIKGFPGVKNRHLLVEFTSAPTAGYIDVFFKQEDMSIGGLPINIPAVGVCPMFPVVFTEDQGYWQVRPFSISGNTYNITATGEGFSTIGDATLCTLTLLKRPDNTTNWTSQGTHIQPAGTLTKPILQRTGLTTFSDFGYGGGILNLLPIELKYITASCTKGGNLIAWGTASELDNDYFIVERSIDGINFEPVTIIDGAGNSNTDINYSYLDQYQSDLTYYRIVQVDFSKKTFVSDIVSADCIERTKTIQVYNSDNDIYAYISSTSEKTFELSIYTTEGQLVEAQQIQVNNGANYIKLTDGKLASGIYIVKLNNSSDNFVTKVLVK
jgi:hypothetical protein